MPPVSGKCDCRDCYDYEFGTIRCEKTGSIYEVGINCNYFRSRKVMLEMINEGLEEKEEVDFAEIADGIGRTVAEKNTAYGDSFARSGEILRILYPNGITPNQYLDALGVVRVVDKLFRIATDKDALGESPWRDIAGYGILGVANANKDGSK